MRRAFVEAPFYWPLITAAAFVTAQKLGVGGRLILDAVPMLGILTRSLVQRVREELMLEIERLRDLGLSCDVAVEYTADKMGIDSLNLTMAHFDWLIERHGDETPEEVVRKLQGSA